MQSISRYLMIWLASARYSLVRATMFRGDLFIWSTVELLWISVNVVMIAVIYSHTRTVAGWSQYEMLLLVGTSMLIQRFLMGFFWSGIFEMGRNVRSGLFDFTLAQPGDPLFMASTRKLELDGLLNSVVAGGLVAYSAWKLGLHPGAGALLSTACMVACGVVIHYSALVHGDVARLLDHELAGRRGKLLHASWSSRACRGRRSRAWRASSSCGCCRSSSSATGPRANSCTASSRRGRPGSRAATAAWFVARGHRVQARTQALHERKLLMSGDVDLLQERIGHRFRDPALLERALTHSSWLQDHPGAPGNNQRLEFLGDSVLQLVLTEAMFSLYPGDREGELDEAPFHAGQG